MAQHHFDFLEVREEDLGHNALFPPHLPNISNRKWLPWSKELNFAVILQDCRIITLTSSERLGFADASVKDRRRFLVSHSPWSTCSSNPSTFTREALLAPTIAGERASWLASHQQRGIFVEWWKGISALISLSSWPKRLSIVLFWPRVTHCLFPNSKWTPTGFHVWSTTMQYILPAGSSPPFSIYCAMLLVIQFTWYSDLHSLVKNEDFTSWLFFKKSRAHIRKKRKGQREIIAILDSSINFLPIFNLAFNLISFMTLILSTYVLQDIVSLESPWICSTTAELNEWILCFWFQLTPYLILI